MLELKPVTLDTCREEYCRYASSLRLVDTFWDDMILEAQIYAICDGEVLGYVSHHEKEDLLSSFILLKNGVLRLQEIFSHIRTALHPRGARIVSGDELFLAAAFDHTASIELKAFFFDLTDKPVKPADYPREWFYEAVETDLPELMRPAFITRRSSASRKTGSLSYAIPPAHLWERAILHALPSTEAGALSACTPRRISAKKEPAAV